jgi:hypothetical protein
MEIEQRGVSQVDRRSRVAAAALVL